MSKYRLGNGVDEPFTGQVAIDNSTGIVKIHGLGFRLD